DLP
ncbi:hypothetical protein D041_0615B, partial [Vibrio parahaemolyticus EKP-008]